jgi:hypothetical protein
MSTGPLIKEYLKEVYAGIENNGKELKLVNDVDAFYINDFMN